MLDLRSSPNSCQKSTEFLHFLFLLLWISSFHLDWPASMKQLCGDHCIYLNFSWMICFCALKNFGRFVLNFGDNGSHFHSLASQNLDLCFVTLPRLMYLNHPPQLLWHLFFTVWRGKCCQVAKSSYEDQKPFNMFTKRRKKEDTFTGNCTERTSTKQRPEVFYLHTTQSVYIVWTAEVVRLQIFTVPVKKMWR